MKLILACSLAAILAMSGCSNRDRSAPIAPEVPADQVEPLPTTPPTIDGTNRRPELAIPANRPDFAPPSWNAGDSWRVMYTVQMSANLKQSAPAPTTWGDFTYTYTARAAAPDPRFPGRPVVKIDVTSEDGLGDWVMIFDQDAVLLAVEEIVPGAASIEQQNPYVPDSWLAQVGRFAVVIHDFPVFRATRRLVSETVDSTAGGFPSFRQTETYSGRERATTVHVRMARTDPVTQLIHETIMDFDTGAKWWRAASISLGGEVRVSGVLL